jgi:hypothetical protein
MCGGRDIPNSQLLVVFIKRMDYAVTKPSGMPTSGSQPARSLQTPNVNTTPSYPSSYLYHAIVSERIKPDSILYNFMKFPLGRSNRQIRYFNLKIIPTLTLKFTV